MACRVVIDNDGGKHNHFSQDAELPDYATKMFAPANPTGKVSLQYSSSEDLGPERSHLRLRWQRRLISTIFSKFCPGAWVKKLVKTRSGICNAMVINETTKLPSWRRWGDVRSPFAPVTLFKLLSAWHATRSPLSTAPAEDPNPLLDLLLDNRIIPLDIPL